ncbi:hypothetical protein [Archangium sp.]|uniref:hypothetical protein n=1 Tax=Archangium sp. TaxID=1872627 RepID=UPI002D5DD78F|nr:hypothetical protein [Archangium sp.]HYO60117.1 hypothetical protein [Archangium sp.]
MTHVGEQPSRQGALAQALPASAPRHQEAHEQRREARAQRSLENGGHVPGRQLDGHLLKAPARA